MTCLRPTGECCKRCGAINIFKQKGKNICPFCGYCYEAVGGNNGKRV